MPRQPLRPHIHRSARLGVLTGQESYAPDHLPDLSLRIATLLEQEAAQHQLRLGDLESELKDALRKRTTERIQRIRAEAEKAKLEERPPQEGQYAS